MDDGFAYPKDANAVFCTHGFSREECEFLVEKLKVDLGVDSKVREEWRGYPIIYVGRNSYFDVMEQIKPHVQWDCFKYKIDTTTYNKKTQIGEDHSQAKLTEAEAKSIFDLKKTGLSHKEIANKLSISSENVSMILNGLRWSQLGLGVRNAKPRTTEEIRNKILLLNSSMNQNQIANELGINQSTVSRIIKGEQCQKLI